MTDHETIERPASELLRERMSLGQEIAEIIRESIRSGRLSQGERVVESKLAKELGLSLTPVREAVRQLVGEGILTVSPNRGPSVLVLSPDDAYELYSLRGQLEGLAIKLAIRGSSVEAREPIRQHFRNMLTLVDDPTVPELQEYSRHIHEGIIALSGHQRLISFYASLSLQIALLNQLVAPRSNKQHEVDWHRPVVEALFYDDPEAAEAVMIEHLRQSYEAYVASYQAAQSSKSKGIINRMTVREWV